MVQSVLSFTYVHSTCSTIEVLLLEGCFGTRYDISRGLEHAGLGQLWRESLLLKEPIGSFIIVIAKHFF